MLHRNLLVLGLCLTGSDAIAQCAPGVPSAGNPGCIPPNQPNSPYYQPQPSGEVPPAPRPVWADRWGAVALDTTTGSAGFATGESSKKDASRAAINDCAGAGSQNCKVLISYYNQCAALAQEDGGGVVYAATSADLGDAKTKALSDCGKSSCSVVYSNCVAPQRVK